MNGGKRSRGRTYWCPHGCGKLVEYVLTTTKKGFYCKKCKRLIAKTYKELRGIM